MGWLSNVVHGVLDVAGMIPGVGAVADGLNAVIYLAEGDYANAAMSAVAMVPGIGDSIALASKGAKVMKGMKALSKLDKAKFLLKGAKKAGAKALGSVKGLMKEGGKLLKDFDYKFAWKSIKDKTKCFFGKGKCFTGDTLVKVEHGYVPICEIQAGDLVWSMEEESGESALKRVEEVFCTQAHTIYEIEIEGKEVVKSTAYHPFYVAERGWVDAIQLEVGDLLVTEDGAAEITKIGKYRQEEPIETYNFHVEDWCSYFVSERCVYVHNMVNGEHGSIKEIFKKAKGNGKPKNRRQALNEAKDLAGVPRSQQPSKQWMVGDDVKRRGQRNYVYDPEKSHHGRFYEYDTPKGKRVVAEHTNDTVQGLHTHAGRPKGNANDMNYDFKKNRYQKIDRKDGDHHIRYK